MNSSLDRKQIAAWHRQEGENLRNEAARIQAAAQYHFNAADIVERGEKSIPAQFTALSFTMRHRRNTDEDSVATIANADSGGVTIGRLRSYLEHNGGRVNHVAAHFGVAHDAIQKLIDAKDSGIVVAPRGWLKLATN